MTCRCTLEEVHEDPQDCIAGLLVALDRAERAYRSALSELRALKASGNGGEKGAPEQGQRRSDGSPEHANAAPDPETTASCPQCDDKGYTAVFEGTPQWCTCPLGAQYATEGRRGVYNDGKVV